MKNYVLIFLLSLIPISVLSQKVMVQVIKVEKAGQSEWQILDEKYMPVFPGSEYSQNDSVTFSLDANKRYFLEISVSQINNPDTNFYTLILNNEPVLFFKSDIGPGDHLFPFFTGTKKINAKITGGEDAVISDFPWQIFFISGDYQCGGSIISNKWIVTAAHCTQNDSGTPIPADEMFVRVGVNDPYDSLQGKTYAVKKVIVNAGFNNQTLLNDIALLELEDTINCPNASPIRLITAADVAAGATDPGVMAWVTGWGLTQVYPQVLPLSLMKLQLPIISNAQASVIWGNNIPATDIMAGYLNGNKDACNGDSGGPLVVPVLGEYKLAGIVSWGSQECNTYGAYTRESDFETWIRDSTGVYTPPPPVGDTIICQGVESSQYSIASLPAATAYEWKLLPDTAGTVSWNSGNATVLWNLSFTGNAAITLRVTINGIVSGWSELNVNVVNNPKILSQSADTAICAGQPVTLNVNVEGYDLTYKWLKNGQLTQSGSSNQLKISGSTTDDSGAYTCQVTGPCGTVSSGTINLAVYPLTLITYISPDVEVSFGSNVTLEVDADGHDLMYQWQKDGVILDNSNTDRLFLQDLNATNIGLYRTTVTGTCGTETSDTIYVYVKKANYSTEPDVFLWPSVTTEEFHVALSDDAFYSIRIFDSVGRLFKELTNCRYETTININNLPQGVCIINVFNNSFRKSLKLIKE